MGDRTFLQDVMIMKCWVFIKYVQRTSMRKCIMLRGNFSDEV